METIPPRSCIGVTSIYGARVNAAGNGLTIRWTIPVNQTNAYFTDGVGTNLGTSIDRVAVGSDPDGTLNNVLVNVGNQAGSLTVLMQFLNPDLTPNPLGSCSSSRLVRDVNVSATAPPLTCPTDVTTITAIAVTQVSFGVPFVPSPPYLYTLNPGTPGAISNGTGLFPNVGAGTHTINAREVLVGGGFGCEDSTTIIIAPVAPNPLVLSCPINVDRPACASQADLEVIFQQWLNSFSVDGGFAPVITVRTPTGEVHAPNHCGGTVTVIWSVSDRCGQTDSCTRTFLVRDSLPPQITCAPGGALGCNPTIPGPTAPTITSACPTLPYTFADVVTGPECAQTLTRTYTVTNECGQTATCPQVFTYRIDTTAPVLHDVPAGGDLGCNPTVLPSCNPNVTATDNCDATAAANCSAGQITSDGCGRRQVFTYSKTDSCGNSVSQEAIYTWKVDTTAPVVTCPGDRVLGCNVPTPTPEVATANDNCDGSLPTTSSVGTITEDGCLRRLVITYSATDACGNTGSCQQTFVWTVDLIAPVITLDLAPTLGVDPTPAQILAALGTAQIFDVCSAHLTAADGPVTETESCHFTQTRTWNGFDDCGNQAAQVQRTVTWTTSGCNPPNGCTLGYWKNHTLAWCPEYKTCTLYKDVFSGSTLDPNLTLVQALNLKGNTNCENLARQSVAAVLNICNGTLNYSVATIADLQGLVNAAFAEGTCGPLGATLDGFNNLGGADHCNVVKSPNTTQSTCVVLKKGVNATGKVATSTTFKAYPNPFTNSFSIQSSNTIHPVDINVFDILGRNVETRTVNPSEFDFTNFGSNYPTGIYNIILNQATEVKTLRMIKQ